MSQVTAATPTAGTVRAPAFTCVAVPAAVPETQWETRVERYYDADLINPAMRRWLPQAIRWLVLEGRQPIYGRARVAFDWLAAVCALAVLSPLFLGIAVAVRATSPGPALFVQTRVGRGCRAFRMYKFRTMPLGSEDAVPYAANTMAGGMFKILADPRVTPVGRWLRRWSLDELPQLLNVVLGDMALLGPRPLEPEHACAVPAELLDRFALRPGISGLWQATARSAKDGRLKLRLDVEYVHTRDLALDARLLLLTLRTIATGDGAV